MLKFSIKKCLDYISSVSDFAIEFERKPSYDHSSRTINYEAECLKVKSYLKRFIMECKKESSKDDYDFIEWLGERKLHWKGQQYRIIGSLNDRLLSGSADEKPEIEKKITRYADFFDHIYKLIEMIENDMMNNLDHLAVPSDKTTVLLHDTSTHGEQSRTTCAEHSRSISSFDQLFKEGCHSEAYFQLLRDHEYPLIGSEYNYVSKSLKSGFCLWITELQRQNIIEHQADKVYADLLLKKVSGLKSFNESSFRKTNNQAEGRYKEYFRKKIAEIKLSQDSQDSQNGKLGKL